MQKRKIINKTDSSSKKHKKRALGRGLDSLLPDIVPVDETAKEYLLCDIGQISSNRYQPRVRFSKEELNDLSASIKSQGIIQPLVVRKGEGAGYELIAGERRLRAAKLAGIKKVPVVIRNVSDRDLLEISIVENIQREQLNCIEEAEAYHRLMAEFHLTQDQVALRVGKSRSTIANFIRLRKLPEEIKTAIKNNMLSMGHARALLGAETSAYQRAAWKAIASKGLSVRETENLIKRLNSEKKKSRKSEPDSEAIYFTEIADDLSRCLGSRVRINKHGRKGNIVIDFYTNKDLDRLLDIFKNI